MAMFLFLSSNYFSRRNHTLSQKSYSYWFFNNHIPREKIKEKKQAKKGKSNKRTRKKESIERLEEEAKQKKEERGS